DQRWRKPVDRIVFLSLNRAALVYWISCNIKHPPHDTIPDRHVDWATSIHHLKATFMTLASGHGDCPDQFVGRMFVDFGVDIHGPILNLVFDSQRVIDPGQSVWEFHVHDRTDNLNNFAFAHVKTSFTKFLNKKISDYAACPPAISNNSFVMLP